MNKLTKIILYLLVSIVFIFTNKILITEAFGGAGFFDGGAAFGSGFLGGVDLWGDFNQNTAVNNVSNVSSVEQGNVDDVSSNSVQNVSNVSSSAVNNVSNVSSVEQGNVDDVSSNSVQNVSNVSSSAVNNVSNVSSVEQGNVDDVSQGTIEINHETNIPHKTIPNPPTPKEPTCSMELTTSSIEKGESAVLSWSSFDASSVEVSNLTGDVALNGSRVVSPENTTTYEGVFSGEGKEVVCQVTLVVKENQPNPPTPKEPTCTMSVSPEVISKGERAVLDWSSLNTTSVSFNNLTGIFGTSGSVTVSPHQDTTYVGTFKNSNGKTVVCRSVLKIKSSLPKSCITNCGGGGVNPPNVYLALVSGGVKKPEPSFIYLNQVPYTGPPLETVKMLMFLMRSFLFGGLLVVFYKLK